MAHLSDTTLFDDVVRSAVRRAHEGGEPSAVLAVRLTDPGLVQALLEDVRASDVATDLGDGTYALVLSGVGRLSAAAVAERFERTTGGSPVGMTLIAPWDRRASATVLRAASEDLRLRIERDAPAGQLTAA